MVNSYSSINYGLTYTFSLLSVIINGSIGVEIVNVGVPKGTQFGPICYPIYIDWFFIQLQNLKLIMMMIYAYTAGIVCFIQNMDLFSMALQRDLIKKT